ncbi:beta strand repeat-containing protein [Fluviicola taffensis]|uniref:Polymorphic outer membrane protein n=1 Tax=Fluviicola taffensis (strain DSM 16823 / NCIMB 13979 / RW262) TaxID=755732 RepID=F2IB04_FLUTR|nr:choice-of-anchor Q domain-containing protein [Fluviicola taffensis]AEA45328.1 polymorphic outer membrane protein [Fluviicola taffensis DSM 16823]
MKKLFLFILFSLTTLIGFSGVFTVQNTNDSGIGSLRQAVMDANSGDSITFNPNLISGGNNSIVLTSGEISYNKNLTIIGLITATDTLFVSGNNSSRIFNITGGTTILDKMAIVNGFNSSQGGGIKAYLLTIRNSIIRNNSASGASNTAGGGIFAFNVTIKNSLIIDNTSISSASTAVGGGIFSTYLTVSNSTITENIAKSNATGDLSYGGGISTSNLTIDHSIVSENLAQGNLSYGGGVYVSGTMTITNSTFTNNKVSSGTAAATGGGVYAYASSGLTTLIIDNSTFSGNTAQSSNSSASGGAIYTRSNTVSSSAFSTLEITYSTFVSNTISNTSINATFGAGAAIYADNIYLTIDHSSFTENLTSSKTAAYGGAIYATTDNSPSPALSGLTLKNSILKGNSAASTTTAQGGGIYIISNSISYTSSASNFNLTIDNSIIQGNSASSISGTTYGGGIYSLATAAQSSYNSKIIATITNSTISENMATSTSSTCLGGGIYARSASNSNTSSSNFTIKNTTISGNAAVSSTSGAAGGGLYTLTGNNASIFNLSLNHCTIYGNTASTNSLTSGTYGGGIVCAGVANSALTLINSTVHGNTASSNNTEDGGGIYISPNTNFTIGSSILAGNVGDNTIFGSISTSNGYNIFDDAPVGTVISDQTNVSSVALNLGPLQNNGGSTFTMAPGIGSVAIGMGNPADISDAQNGAIVGIRDVGAAENGITACQTVYDSIVQTICYGATFNFGGNLLTSSGMYKDTMTSINGCDSVVTLNLTVSEQLTGVDTQTACESYTWMDGTNYTENNTLATYTLSSVNGCDSIVTLYLIIKTQRQRLILKLPVEVIHGLMGTHILQIIVQHRIRFQIQMVVIV